MQNRRILDARLAERGLALRPRVTADSYLALLGLVQQGRLCSIIPDSHATLLNGLSWPATRSLPEMGEGSRVGIIVSDSTPMGPLAQAGLGVEREQIGRTAGRVRGCQDGEITVFAGLIKQK